MSLCCTFLPALVCACAHLQNGGSTAGAAASPVAAGSPQAPDLLLEDDEDGALAGELPVGGWVWVVVVLVVSGQAAPERLSVQ
jgi:hypothetical protein